MSEDGPNVRDYDPLIAWGYWLGDTFIPLPKIPLKLAGYTQPPFDVTRPDGRVLHVVALERVTAEMVEAVDAQASVAPELDAAEQP